MMMLKKMVPRLKKIIGIQQRAGVAAHEEEEDDGSSWAQLPPDLVRLVARQLTVPERIRLGAVCTSWSSAAAPEELEGAAGRSTIPMPALFLRELSWLARFLLMKLDLSVPGWGSTQATSMRCTLSLCSHPEKRCYHLLLPPDLVGCYGCCDGWLVLREEEVREEEVRDEVSLFNPATRAQIYLPALITTTTTTTTEEEEEVGTTKECYYIKKVVLSASPTAADPDGFVAVALYEVDDRDETFLRVAWHKSGDQGWTPACCFSFPLGEAIVMDLVYHDKTFFLLSRDHGLFALDLAGSPASPEVFKFEGSTVVDLDDEDGGVDEIFLVSSSASGDLLCVEGKKVPGTGLLEYESFAVRRFDPEAAAAGSSCWIEMKDLGDQSLFLSSVNSVSLPTTTKGSSIYFMEEQFTGRSFPGNKFITWLLGIGSYRLSRFRHVKAYDVGEGTISPVFEFEEDNAMGYGGMWLLPSLL